jgi:hypothetical protein
VSIPAGFEVELRQQMFLLDSHIERSLMILSHSYAFASLLINGHSCDGLGKGHLPPSGQWSHLKVSEILLAKTCILFIHQLQGG